MATEFAWLIEFRQGVTGKPCWYGAAEEGLGIVEDVNKALRFSRKWDAEQVIEEMAWTEAFACEHGWG